MPKYLKGLKQAVSLVWSPCPPRALMPTPQDPKLEGVILEQPCEPRELVDAGLEARTQLQTAAQASQGARMGGGSIQHNFLELLSHLTFVTEGFQAFVNLCLPCPWESRSSGAPGHATPLSLSHNSYSLSQWPKLKKQTTKRPKRKNKSLCLVLLVNGCLKHKPRAGAPVVCR